METYTLEFYDLLSRALGGSDPARLQGYIDEVMPNKYNALQLDGFELDPDMQLERETARIMLASGTPGSRCPAHSKKRPGLAAKSLFLVGPTGLEPVTKRL